MRRFSIAMARRFLEATLSLTGVARIVLPAGAFYDDLRLSSIPEPGVGALVLLGGLCLVANARRSRTARQ